MLDSCSDGDSDVVVVSKSYERENFPAKVSYQYALFQERCSSLLRHTKLLESERALVIDKGFQEQVAVLPENVGR